MRPKSAIRIASALVALLVLAGPTVAVASSQRLTLGLAGGFVDIASQQYQSSGNVPTYVSIGGAVLDAKSTHFSYSVTATVTGLMVTGTGQFKLGGKGATGDLISVEGLAILGGMVPVAGFPLGPIDPLACFSAGTCTSAIPGFFVGVGTLSVTIGGSTTVLTAPMMFESAYLHPFGGPVFIGTPDGTISIASRYSSAISKWDGVMIGGGVTDLSGASIGGFGMVSSLTENLLAGSEHDHGTIALTSFSGPLAVLNSAGDFHGVSTIPRSGNVDCTSSLTALFGFTFPPDTCLATGSHSHGVVSLTSFGGSKIKGTYDIIWSVPALGFAGTVDATIT